MLKLQSPETVRIDLVGGAVAVLNPIEPVAWMRARDVADRISADDPDVVRLRRFALIHSLVHGNLVSWEGIGDAEGEPTDPTRDQWFDAEGKPITAAFAATQAPDDVRFVEGSITRLLKYQPAFDAFEQEYAGPVLSGLYEKNVSAPSRNTTSTPKAGTDTAKGATPTGTPETDDASNVRKG